MESFKLSRVQAIGLFVLLTLIAAFAVINFLRGEDIFNRSSTYYSVFKEVNGLTVTGPIYVRGLKVGMVQDIVYRAEKDDFVIEFKVKSQFNIPANSVAEVYSADIMGTRAIRVTMGDADVYAQPGDTLASGIVPDMITALSSEIGPITVKAEELLTNLNKTLVNVNELLDGGAKEDLQSSFENLNRTLSNAAVLSKSLNEMSPDLAAMVANLQVLSKGLSESAGDIKGTLKNMNDISTQLSQAELDEAIGSLKNLVEKMQDPNGSIGKLMENDSLHQAVTTLLNDVDLLVKNITENPKKYIKVSVF